MPEKRPDMDWISFGAALFAKASSPELYSASVTAQAAYIALVLKMYQVNIAHIGRRITSREKVVEKIVNAANAAHQHYGVPVVVETGKAKRIIENVFGFAEQLKQLEIDQLRAILADYPDIKTRLLTEIDYRWSAKLMLIHHREAQQNATLNQQPSVISRLMSMIRKKI